MTLEENTLSLWSSGEEEAEEDDADNAYTKHAGGAAASAAPQQAGVPVRVQGHFSWPTAAILWDMY